MMRYPWWEPRMGERELEYLAAVMAAHFPNEGAFTDRFESEVAAALKVPFSVATTSGTAAIFLALKACGVGAGDEVIVPDLTFAATATAVVLTGAEPVLVDVEERTLGIDPERVASKIGPTTKAIVPVHVSGRACDIEGVLEIAGGHGLRVVEDAAECLGSTKGGRPLGTFGDAGCLSFSAHKTVTTGQGGMVVTSNKELRDRAAHLKDQGRTRRGTGGDDDHPAIGFNFKMTNLQAAVGLAQLEYLDERVERLKQTYSIYSAELADVAGIDLVGFDLDGGECPQWVDALSDERDDLVRYLLDRQMECRRFWKPLHSHPPFARDASEFPVSEKVSRRAFWLPSAYTLSDEDVGSVCRTVIEWSRQR